MNKVFCLLLIISLIVVFLTGCWNYREIDKLALVAGIAIDKSNTGKGYEITTEIIDVKSSDKSPTFNSIRIQSVGESIFDSIRNMINISAKMLYWGHSSIFIVSKDVAKDGILPILDWIVRDSEPRLTIYLLVSDSNSAKEILNLQSVSTQIRSYEIENMIISNKNLSKVPNIQIHELVNDISTKGIYPVIPTVGEEFNEGIYTMKLSGAAILNRDTLAGFIDLEDVKNYLFIRNKIKGGLLTISLNKDNSKPNMTLDIFRNKTKVTPELSNGQLSMKIKIKTQVSIGESDTNIDILNESNVKKIKSIAEKTLENNISQLIRKMQEDFGLDIFGFGNVVKEKMPALWKDIENNWDEIFKELKVEVDADIHIRGSGHLSKVLRMH